MKKTHVPKMVLIEWIDAQTIDFHGLFVVEDTEGIKPCKAQSVGFLIREDKENYFIAPEMWPEANTEGVCKFKYLHIIPKAYVVKRRFLE